jgi:NAD(P)-dependent dehydrogenase (short-subunit alcohol dehydrogenase family)
MQAGRQSSSREPRKASASPLSARFWSAAITWLRPREAFRRRDTRHLPISLLVDGDISQAETAEEVAKSAIERFGSIDHVVNNAGIYSSKPFTEYTTEVLRGFVSTNLHGFVFITQLAVRQMLAQDRGGSVTSISASLADNPIAGVPASVPMMTKGGIDAITLSLANEYAKKKIRFNAVAPGVVDTPLHKGNLNARSPMGTISEPKEIADAVVYLTGASHVTGEVLHVDDGAHVGRW